MIRMVRGIKNDATKLVIKMPRSENRIIKGFPTAIQQISHMIKAKSKTYYITKSTVAIFRFWITFVAWAASLVKAST